MAEIDKVSYIEGIERVWGGREEVRIRSYIERKVQTEVQTKTGTHCRRNPLS